MGAVTFSIDRSLVNVLKEALPLDVFVETGTFQGDTVEIVKDCFLEIHTIELSPEYFEEARSRFAGQGHIDLIPGDSATVLAELAPKLRDRSVLYFLDAHWCDVDNTDGAISQCPLIDEIRAIGRLNSDSLIVIDDARLFLSPPTAPLNISQWPTFNQIFHALHSLGDNHSFLVLNDNILFVPQAIEPALRQYGHDYGVDWLAVMTVFTKHEQLALDLVAKEAVIQDLVRQRADIQASLSMSEEALARNEKALSDAQVELNDKEEVIRQLIKAVIAYRTAHWVLSPGTIFKKAIQIFDSILAPRLGKLIQHSPVRLRLPGPYSPVTPASGLPMISIVTPSLSQGLFIEKTLQSILDQNYPNLEYFVQDCCSTDETIGILKKYCARLSGYHSRPDNGQSHAINLGFARTTGEIMAWLNSDDFLLPGALAFVGDFFARHPEVDVLYGNRILVDQNDLEIGRWILPGHDSEALSWADFVPQETLFWRRSIWEKTGGRVDESFRFALDWDLLIRFREAGARFAHVPRFLGAFRVHTQQKTSSVINGVGYSEMNRIRQRILGYVPGEKEVCKAVAPFLMRHVIMDLLFRIRRRLGFQK